jgi:hypothetical protein
MLDGHIRRIGCRDINDLGVRAGFLDDEAGQGLATNVTPFLLLVAPHLVHIDQVTLDRSTGSLAIDIERSPQLADRDLSATLVEAGRLDSHRPGMRVAPGSTSVRVVFNDVQDRQAEVALHDDLFPSFSVRTGMPRSRYTRTARSVIATLMSGGGLADLKGLLMSAKGIDVEEPARRLLFLLGYAPWRLDRNATQPAGVPDGILRFDILAFDPRDSIILAAEVTTGFLVPDKLAKLVTRANALRLFLEERLAGMGDAPTVQPLMIVTTDRAPAPPHLIAAAADYGAGLIAREDLAALVDHLEAGDHPAARGRFDSCFPNNSWTRNQRHIYRIDEEW